MSEYRQVFTLAENYPDFLDFDCAAEVKYLVDRFGVLRVMACLGRHAIVAARHWEDIPPLEHPVYEALREEFSKAMVGKTLRQEEEKRRAAVKERQRQWEEFVEKDEELNALKRVFERETDQPEQEGSKS